MKIKNCFVIDLEKSLIEILSTVSSSTFISLISGLVGELDFLS